MSKYEDDDPIQEYTRESIFFKLKKFEKNDEYDFEKKNKNDTNTSSKNYIKNDKKKEFTNYYPRTKYNSINANVGSGTKLLALCFLGFIVFCFFLPIIIGLGLQDIIMDWRNDKEKPSMPFETSLGSENPELNDELDNVLFSRSEVISFDNAGKIPTLYKYDKKTKANWCNFTELDSRFSFNVNTIQFNYNNIPQSSKYDLSQGLINRHYELVNNYPTGDLYAINTENGYFMFVLISSNDIIYGAAQGNYEGVFNVMEK